MPSAVNSVDDSGTFVFASTLSRTDAAWAALYGYSNNTATQKWPKEFPSSQFYQSLDQVLSFIDPSSAGNVCNVLRTLSPSPTLCGNIGYGMFHEIREEISEKKNGKLVGVTMASVVVDKPPASPLGDQHNAGFNGELVVPAGVFPTLSTLQLAAGNDCGVRQPWSSPVCVMGYPLYAFTNTIIPSSFYGQNSCVLNIAALKFLSVLYDSTSTAASSAEEEGVPSVPSSSSLVRGKHSTFASSAIANLINSCYLTFASTPNYYQPMINVLNGITCQENGDTPMLSVLSSDASSALNLFAYFLITGGCIAVLLMGGRVAWRFRMSLSKHRNVDKENKDKFNKYLQEPFMDSTNSTESRRNNNSTDFPVNVFDNDMWNELQKVQIDLDEIEFLNLIGSGTMAEVYRGTWRGTPVAVKKVLMTHIAFPHIVDAFKEAYLMSTMRHPNVLLFLGIAFSDPHIYIVTEFCKRGSLDKVLRNGGTKDVKHHPITLSRSLARKDVAPLPDMTPNAQSSAYSDSEESSIVPGSDVGEGLSSGRTQLSLLRRCVMALDVVRGMRYLHGQSPPIMHRDLKCANLLVDDRWRIKVSDFGLSTHVEENRSRMTLCGTPYSCAPEVLQGHTYTEKADVYSMGIVLWEIVTCTDPYQGYSKNYRVTTDVVEKGLRPPIPSSVPPSLATLINQCWASDAQQRPTFDEIYERLSVVIKEIEGREQKQQRHSNGPHYSNFSYSYNSNSHSHSNSNHKNTSHNNSSPTQLQQPSNVNAGSPKIPPIIPPLTLSAVVFETVEPPATSTSSSMLAGMLGGWRSLMGSSFMQRPPPTTSDSHIPDDVDDVDVGHGHLSFNIDGEMDDASLSQTVSGTSSTRVSNASPGRLSTCSCLSEPPSSRSLSITAVD